ncbi:CU044_2847 family protein [Streptomyces sp. NPDC001914]|uniref:CU044_2847 family protein n=1 Tax=Streptomyces sp. NPDC001914 TaxID=3364623 RepID=UPI0036A51491
MDGLVEFRTEDGARVVVEAVDDGSGSRLVARDDGTVQATRTFEGSLEGVRAAAGSALRVFRDGSLRPDSVEIEFGVKLTAEAGALIAKSAVEGHLVVKLSWASDGSGHAGSGPASATASETGATAANGAGTGSGAGTAPGPGTGAGAGTAPGPGTGAGAGVPETAAVRS